MNELSKYLVEQILLEEPTPIKKTIVVYVGRFQPFHKGHYGTYSHLVKKFGKDNVYIGTSNKVEKPKSPFNFKEKKEIMTTMFGVPSNKIFEVKNPYAPLEILKKFDEKTTAFITVVGEKDASRLGGKYFKKWDGEATEGYKDRGYVYASPMQGDSVSGTEVRIGLGSGTEEQKKNFFLDRAYPKFNKTIFSLITNKLQESCIRLTKTQIEDLLIEISSGMGQDMVDDGPVIFLPDYNSFKVINGERAQQIGWEIINMVMDDSMDDYITYPEGPVGKNTFFPRGAIGKKDPMGEFDVMVNGAYDKWYKHVTRTASLVGYSVVDKALGIDDKLSTQLAKGAKSLAKESDKTIQRESITLPVEIGDTLLMGKFKNKKVVVKTIGKDEHGMPTINGKKVVTFRLVKEGKQIIFEDEGEDEKLIESDPIMIEALTQAQRAARRWTFQKNKKLINIKKQRTQIRKKPYSVLSKRAHKLAYLYVRKEWAQRLFGNTPYDELSLPQKQRVSQMVQKKKRKILKLAKFRFLPALKQKEADRFKGVHQYPSNLTFDTSTNEMSMSQLKGVERYAEKQLSPQDIEFTKHFFDRVNDPRNGKPISDAELTGFFKRLSKIKNKFKEFLEKYKEIVVRDKRYDINIPFVKQSNQIIAKTVMRKDDFKSSDPILSFESEDTIDEVNSGFYDGVRGSMTPNDAAGATGYMYNHNWEEYDEQDYYLANLPGFTTVHEKPSDFEKKRAVDQGLPLNVHGDGKTTKYNRILKADFIPPDEVFKKSIKKESKIPGGLSQGMSLSDIAKKHKVSIGELTDEFKKGYKVEGEHTTDIDIAKEIAMDHLFEDPKYYTKLKKIEETIQKVDNKWVVYRKSGGEKLGTHETYEEALKQLRAIELQKFEKINNKIEELAPHGYPDQEWMDNHEKEMKKLRKQLDKMQKVNEVAARYIEPKRVEAFLKKYPKVEDLLQKIVDKVKDVDRGYQIFLHYKNDKGQEQYFGGKKDTKSKSTNVKGLGRTVLNKTGKSLNSKTSYKYEWDGKMDYPTWGEVFQYIWNKKYEVKK